MAHERVRHRPDPVTGITQPPAEVDVRAVGEVLVESADGVERLPAESQVDRGALREIPVRGDLPRRGEAVRIKVFGGRERGAGRDVLPVVERSDQPGQPAVAGVAAGVGEDDDVTLGGAHSGVALVRDRHSGPGRAPEPDPAHGRLVRAPDLVEAAVGGVDDQDLAGLADPGGLLAHRAQGAVQRRLVLADDDDGDHPRNTSEEPFAYTTLKFASRKLSGKTYVTVWLSNNCRARPSTMLARLAYTHAPRSRVCGVMSFSSPRLIGVSAFSRSSP